MLGSKGRTDMAVPSKEFQLFLSQTLSVALCVKFSDTMKHNTADESHRIRESHGIPDLPD